MNGSPAEPIDSDARLDAELVALFDIEPSAHFVSRVRAHVAADAAAAPRRWRWMVPAAAFAVAALMLVVWPGRDVEEVGPRPLLTMRSLAAPFSSGVLAASLSPDTTPAPRVASHRFASTVPSPARSLEVLIDPGESAALQRLVARGVVPQREVQVAAAPVSSLGPLPVLNPVEIHAMADIQPLSIEPLDAADEGVPQ